MRQSAITGRVKWAPGDRKGDPDNRGEGYWWDIQKMKQKKSFSGNTEGTSAGLNGSMQNLRNSGS